MRCGKVEVFCLVRVAFRVATRTNALWQRRSNSAKKPSGTCRNPHEYAVAKDALQLQLCGRCSRNPRECAEAKRLPTLFKCALLSRNPRECAEAKIVPPCAAEKGRSVATRANALSQSQYRHGSLTASPSRNPRECAEAKCSMPASALMPSLRVPLFTTLNNPCPQVR